MRTHWFATVLVFAGIATIALAQKTIGSLPVKHANAIQSFIAKYPALEFLSESSYPSGELSYIRDVFKEKNLTPYYRTGDFSHDGRRDFAVVLIKDVPPTKESEDPSTWTHHLTLVVFNGQKDGGYKAVFVKAVHWPLTSFLSSTSEKKPKLVFGIAETDAGFIVNPAGLGYVAEYGNR